MYAIKNFREASTFRKRGLNATDILSMLLPRFTKYGIILFIANYRVLNIIRKRLIK